MIQLIAHCDCVKIILGLQGEKKYKHKVKDGDDQNNGERPEDTHTHHLPSVWWDWHKLQQNKEKNYCCWRWFLSFRHSRSTTSVDTWHPSQRVQLNVNYHVLVATLHWHAWFRLVCGRSVATLLLNYSGDERFQGKIGAINAAVAAKQLLFSNRKHKRTWC